jgi:alkane 1-monooxygenase
MISRLGFLLPLILPLSLVAGGELGGAWTWLTVLIIFGLVPLLDLVLGRDCSNPDENVVARLESDWFYRGIVYAWVPLHFALLGYAIWRMGIGFDTPLASLGFIVSTGTVTGAVGITVAYELGHKLKRWEQWLGRLLLVSVGYMHFHIEHNKGHHAHVATPHDPATARQGQSLYAFLPQTLKGSLVNAWRIEHERLARMHDKASLWRNHVLLGFGMTGTMAAAALFVAGWAGALLFVMQAIVAILLLEVINYIEHYGLQRQERGDGGYERVDVIHSWNASERLTNWFLFNLQRHSHHHVAHYRRYQVLQHHDSSTQLPTGYAGMLLLALVPPIWNKVMNPRLDAWRKEYLV